VFSARDSEATLASLAVPERTLERHHDHEEELFLPMAGPAMRCTGGARS